jgi:heavy metal translocating P-type ATPase
MLSETDIMCALCQNVAARHHHRIEEGEAVFCCKGCQVVYHILKAQGALEKFQDHPVYRQALQAGLITNPHLQFSKQEEEKIPEEDFQKLHLTIQNMWCPSCAQVIHLILLKEKGVRQCVVDYSTDLASIEFTPRLISKDKILHLIRQLGYQPHFLQDPRQKAISRTLMLRLIVAAFFSLNVMMFAYPIYATYFDEGDAEGYAKLFAWFSFIGFLPVLLYSGWPIWHRCYIGLKVRIWGMEALVCMGVAAAMGLSLYELFRNSPYVYFDSVTVIILFVLLGKVMESKAKFSAKDSLVKLSLSLPCRGRKRLTTGEECFVSIKDIHPDDLLVVRMGEKIVLDGIVEEGSGACDESLMTGESLPVAKQKGSFVLAGTLLQQGYLVVKVIASLEETTLQRIIDMVSQDIGHKSRYVRAADSIVRWFIPFVIGLALATGSICLVWGIADGEQTIVQTAIIRAISVLLISCPCAIGIAAPLAEAYLLNALAKLGILVRNRGCLAFLGRETLFVFDKTGTVTEGRFTVCAGLESLTFEEKQALKGIACHSLHPIAVALHAALLCPPASFEKIEEIVGKGMQGMLDGKKYYLGSAAFFEQLGISVPLQIRDNHSAILTTVYFAKESHCLAALILGDQLRAGVKEFIQLLFPLKTLLISGDAEAPVAKVAAACQIQEWRAGYHPLQKKELIDNLKKEGEVIVMLGDGMNDAPALAAAHIGVAIISATDISIQVSDLLLTTNNYHALSISRQVALKGKRIIKQNIFWAFFYNCVGLGVAAAGLLTPLFAAFAMVISSLIVLLNAQRIALIAKEPKAKN